MEIPNDLKSFIINSEKYNEIDISTTGEMYNLIYIDVDDVYGVNINYSGRTKRYYCVLGSDDSEYYNEKKFSSLKECINFIHSEASKPNVPEHIKKGGNYILQYDQKSIIENIR